MMDKELQVAFIGTRPLKYDGIQYNQGFDDYGMRLYRLNIEQIINIVETVELGRLDDEQFGIAKERSENILYGSREYPISNSKAAELIKNVDVFIIPTGVGALFAKLVANLIKDCLPQFCTIIFRLPFEREDTSKAIGSVKAEEWCKDFNLRPKEGKRKLWSRSSSNKEIFVIGPPELGGIHQDESIPLLKASLLKEQAIKDVVKPIKETVGIFTSITNWINRVVH